MKIIYLIAYLAMTMAINAANNEADKAKCDEPIDKSAVTKEAADAAAKVIQNPPTIYNTEVYTSKVKSIFLIIINTYYIKLKFHLNCFKVLRPAPFFSGNAVVKGEFVNLKLSDFAGKYLILLFYPLDFTFVCPTEIIAFSDRIAEFRKINTEVIAISTDSQFTHLAWINTPRKQGT